MSNPSSKWSVTLTSILTSATKWSDHYRKTHPLPAFDKDQTSTLVAQPRRRVFDEITDFLKGEIFEGRLQPGDKLKPERDLATELKVSRSSLREALRALEMLDVVEIRHGQGVFVRLPQSSVLSKIFGTLLSMQRGGLDDVMEARIALECQAAKLCCRFADEADFLKMERALRRLERSGHALEQAEADHEFHSAIVESTKNATLIFLYRAIDVLLRQSHIDRWRRINRIPQHTQALQKAHVAILQAIQSRHEAQAVKATEAHFKLTCEIFEQLESNPGETTRP